jgi:proteic killer suppression protein
VIRSYRSKALKKFAVDGDASKLPVQNADRIRLLLSRLDASVKPEDMNLPGFGFHGLQGKRRRYAVTASANYRITFGWEGEDAVAVDLEDYH